MNTLPAILFLNAPKQLEFGIDFNLWTIGPKFKGLKAIPIGIHFVHYSLKGSFKTGFFHDFTENDLVVWETDEDQLHRYRHNLREFEFSLGDYPITAELNNINLYEKWRSMSGYINNRLLFQVLPSSLKISSMSSTSKFSNDWTNTQKQDLEQVNQLQNQDIIPTSIEQLNYLNQQNEILMDTSESNQTLAMNTDQENERDDQGLNDWINFSVIDLKLSFPVGSTPTEITKYSLDKSYLFETILTQNYNNEHEIIGELQLSFVLFHFGQLFDGFEQWKLLVHLFCFSIESILKHVDLYMNFINTLKFQLEEFPVDFFKDELSSTSFLVSCLSNLCTNIKETENVGLENQLKKLIDFVDNRFDWDLNHDIRELDEGEDAPMVVELSEG
ncbi:A1 cistron-splicing factor [Globomyces pollinis-pini]|nr:A1 cistron-splicing factor [Globomyces pollinis-pini]